MENNTYFDEMYRIGHEWSLAHRVHEALKEQIIREKGWDSEELKAWYAEEEKFPFSNGANKAYRAWRYSQGLLRPTPQGGFFPKRYLSASLSVNVAREE